MRALHTCGAAVTRRHREGRASDERSGVHRCLRSLEATLLELEHDRAGVPSTADRRHGRVEIDADVRHVRKVATGGLDGTVAASLQDGNRSEHQGSQPGCCQREQRRVVLTACTPGPLHGRGIGSMGGKLPHLCG